MTRVCPVDEPSRVAEVRRATTVLAQDEGLNDAHAGNAALVATEICTNLVKHARGGEVFLSTLSDRGEPGIEMLAIDRGPGITDVERSLTDGYSSTQTSGTGLGAVSRLSQEFDIYSDAKGTALVARILRIDAQRTQISGILKPLAGEESCGDAWTFKQRGEETALIVADGLGHGPLAARASEEAISVFRRSKDFSSMAILQQVHGSLRSTRGAAVAVAHIDRAGSTVKYSGIGNITGVLIGSGRPVMMISHNGTAGYHSPRLQEFSYPLAAEGMIILHSDGLHTNWNLDDYPGLRRRDPSIIAGVLYRDAARSRDDVCVVAAKTGDGIV